MKNIFMKTGGITELTTIAAVTNQLTSIPSGICVVYKPPGISSAGAVSRIKNILQNHARSVTGTRHKIKVGHGGTLDPMAEGALVLGIGAGTTLLTEFLSGSKGYTAVGLLGTETDTLDNTGKIIRTLDASNITHNDIEKELEKFKGNITQIPPMYSALKFNGKRLYAIARSGGEEVERKPRSVIVYKLDLISNHVELPQFCLQVECSGGFYIRSLIHELAQNLNNAACMTQLIRSKQGQYVLSDCLHENDWDVYNICQNIQKNSIKVGFDPNSLKSLSLL